MALTAAQLQLLKAEVFGANKDPQGYGYAPFVTAGADNAIADLLNFVRDGTTPCPVNNVVGPAITGIRRVDISADDVLEAIDSRDLATTTNTAAGGYLAALLARPRLQLIGEDGQVTRIQSNLNRLLSNTQQSQTRVTALMTRTGSRVEQLLNASGVRVTAADVAAARAA